MNPNHLNLYIVDDDEPVRRSMLSLLALRVPEFSIKCFDSGESFLANAQTDASGVVLLDFRMDGMSGLDVFAQLKARNSPLVAIFLSGHGTIDNAVHAMQDGAVSWLQKLCSDDELVATVQKARERSIAIATRRRDQHQAQQRWDRLTPREKQVAWEVASGKQNKVIARDLSTSDSELERRTVETHRSKIFSKLDMGNATELLAFLRDFEIPRE
jgi:FixJ family two-component response regulator